MSDIPKRDIEQIVDELIGVSINRRTLLRGVGAGTLGMSFASFLAACGGGVESDKKTATVIPKGQIADRLNFSNWPLYVDVNEKTKRRPTLDNFKKKFGTTVKYTEEINDNNEFFGKVRQQFASGDSGGRDLFVVTDWMASKMKRLGYVQKLDHSVLPNVDANLLDSLKHPGFDPDREFTVPWQTGLTGLIYRRDKTGPLNSVNDIFDPKFKGKVTMLTEMRDSVGLTMLGMGKDPATDGLDAALEAVDKIDKANRDGQIRRFTGNDYTKDLTKGDAWVVYGWSGDAVQLKADNPNIDVLLPPEGFMLWADNMMVPVGAPHAYTAEVMMNYVYDPEVQANIAAYVNYVTPVKHVKDVLAKSDPELAKNPLIFPSPEDLKRAHIFRELPPNEEDQLNNRFEQVIGA